MFHARSVVFQWLVKMFPCGTRSKGRWIHWECHWAASGGPRQPEKT